MVVFIEIISQSDCWYDVGWVCLWLAHARQFQLEQPGVHGPEVDLAKVWRRNVNVNVTWSLNDVDKFCNLRQRDVMLLPEEMGKSEMLYTYTDW